MPSRHWGERDRNAKTWYAPPGVDLTKLQQWTVMPTEFATREIEDQFTGALTEMGWIATSALDGKALVQGQHEQ